MFSSAFLIEIGKLIQVTNITCSNREAFPSFRRSKATPSVYLSSKCMVRGFKFYIYSSVLLISNHYSRAILE